MAVDATLSQTVLWIGIPVQLIFNSIVGYIAFRLKSNAGQIATLETRLHKTTEALIDARFRAMTHEVNNHVQGLISAVDELKTRLKDDGAAIEELGEGKHELELKMLQKIFEVQREILEKGASKGDLKVHEESMRREMGQLRTDVAQQINRRNI